MNVKLQNLRKCFKENGEVALALAKDVRISAELFENETFDNELDQFWRRSYIRTLFSAIEGFCYGYKNIALQIAEVTDFGLSVAELALLKEENYSLNDKGEAKTQKAKLRTLENILFTINISSKVYKENIEINKNSVEGLSLKRALSIRNRITHPKQSSDILIKDDEIESVLNAGNCFIEIIGQINEIVSKTIKNLA